LFVCFLLEDLEESQEHTFSESFFGLVMMMQSIEDKQ
jgi:hypothetical protein